MDFNVYIAEAKLHLITSVRVLTEQNVFKVFDRFTDVEAPADKNIIAIRTVDGVCFTFLKLKL